MITDYKNKRIIFKFCCFAAAQDTAKNFFDSINAPPQTSSLNGSTVKFPDLRCRGFTVEIEIDLIENKMNRSGEMPIAAKLILKETDFSIFIIDRQTEFDEIKNLFESAEKYFQKSGIKIFETHSGTFIIGNPENKINLKEDFDRMVLLGQAAENFKSHNPRSIKDFNTENTLESLKQFAEILVDDLARKKSYRKTDGEEELSRGGQKTIQLSEEAAWATVEDLLNQLKKKSTDPNGKIVLNLPYS